MTVPPHWIPSPSAGATALQKAFHLADRAHAGKTRKGKDQPYIHHLIRVAELIRDFGGNEDQICAGLLHDTIEDTDVTDELLARETSGEVARIVLVCSDTNPAVDGTTKPEWHLRKPRYHARLAAEPNNDPALLVSLCDKIDNAEDSAKDLAVSGPAEFWRPFNAGDECQLWNYRTLHGIYLAKITDPRHTAAVNRFGRVLDELFSGREILPCPSSVHTR